MLKLGEQIKSLIQELIRSEEFVLYDNPSGSNENIILNDDSTNYRCIEIFYYSYSSYTPRYSSVKVYMPLTERIILQSIVVASTSYVVGMSADYKISGTSLTKEANNTVILVGGTGATTNEIYITKVVGHK